MALSVGIIGLPNVGKSTLFSALTRNAVNISNYPFTTVDPNVGVVSIPDGRLEKIASASKSARIVHATIEFVDIAGLVRGAHQGEGLGNQFLAHIREVDAIVEVVRAFENPEIIHVEGEPDPMRDHGIVEAELLLKDLETVEKSLEKVEREARAGLKESKRETEILSSLRDLLYGGVPMRTLPARGEARQEARSLSLLTEKPLFALVNSVGGRFEKGCVEEFSRVGIPAVVSNLKEECETSFLSEQERRELGVSDQPLATFLQEALKTLDRTTFFTANAKEAHAWLVAPGTLLPKASGAVHTDFEQNFIRADVISWERFVEAGGWVAARAKGWARSEGKAYVVQDGDVIEVKHG